MPNVQRSRPAPPSTKVLLEMCESLWAEVEAHRRAGRALPRYRRDEISEALEGLLAETQRSWSDLPPRYRAVVESARARMLEAIREHGLPSTPKAPRLREQIAETP